MALLAAAGAVSAVGGTAAAGTAALSAGSLLSIVSTGFSIFSTLASGAAESRDLKAQARAEKFNATTREIDRKKNLVRALALQTVRGAAGGIGTGGSLAAIQQADVRDFELDQAIDRAGTGQRISQLRQNARFATTFSLLSAGGEAIRYGRRGARRGSARA